MDIQYAISLYLRSFTYEIYNLLIFPVNTVLQQQKNVQNEHSKHNNVLTYTKYESIYIK